MSRVSAASSAVDAPSAISVTKISAVAGFPAVVDVPAVIDVVGPRVPQLKKIYWKNAQKNNDVDP